METRNHVGTTHQGNADDQAPTKPAERPTFSAPQRAGGSRATGSIIGKKIVKLAQQHPNWSYQRIADKVCSLVEGANTSSKSVASVIADARRNGVDVPARVRPH